jgi:sulfate adenylyltransferase subunit 1
MNSPKRTSLLRFTTAGSVDDGKSTLIGRLLYDTHAVFEDQLATIQRLSDRRGSEHLDLSLLTDGLKAEREQGITIDVAYRYFSTAKRKFIIADTPGHFEYTRNMVTGASTADVALILIDARKGVVEQTRRHSVLSAMLGLHHLVVCVNKMDLVDFSQERFESVVHAFEQMAEGTLETPRSYIPISALLGENVATSSGQMPWYTGPSLIDTLENIDTGQPEKENDFYLPVQTIIHPRDQMSHDFRGYAGRIASGTIRIGDAIHVLPTLERSTVQSIRVGNSELESATAGMSVCLTLTNELDVSRGSILTSDTARIRTSDCVEATLCWLGNAPQQDQVPYRMVHCNKTLSISRLSVTSKIRLTEQPLAEATQSLAKNDIAHITLSLPFAMAYAGFTHSKTLGSFILVDPRDNNTVAAGILH